MNKNGKTGRSQEILSFRVRLKGQKSWKNRGRQNGKTRRAFTARACFIKGFSLIKYKKTSDLAQKASEKQKLY